MSTNNGNWIRLLASAVVLAFFLPLQGCAIDDVPSVDKNALNQEEITNSLVEGQFYEVELQILDDGTLYATEIEAEGDEDEDEAEFSAQVESVAADCSSFVVLGGLTVVLDGDNDDEDDEDEDDEDGDDEDGDDEADDGDEEDGEADADDDDDEAEDDDDDNEDEADDDDDDNEDEDGDDDDDDLGICDLSVGMWIEAEGVMGDDGIFHAEEIEAEDEEEIEIEASLESLGASSFAMLGLTIVYDGNTVLEEDEEDDDQDDDDDNQDDDDDNEDDDDDNQDDDDDEDGEDEDDEDEADDEEAGDDE